MREPPDYGRWNEDSSDDAKDWGPFVAVKSFSDSIEAHIARSKLDSFGIPSFIEGEHVSNLRAGTLLPLRGVVLMVPEKLRAEALSALDVKRVDDDDEDQDEGAENVDSLETIGKLVRVQSPGKTIDRGQESFRLESMQPSLRRSLFFVVLFVLLVAIADSFFGK